MTTMALRVIGAGLAASIWRVFHSTMALSTRASAPSWPYPE